MALAADGAFVTSATYYNPVEERGIAGMTGTFVNQVLMLAEIRVFTLVKMDVEVDELTYRRSVSRTI